MNWRLQRYEPAHADALAAVTSSTTDEMGKASNAKAYRVAGLADYEIAQYRSAAKLFESAIETGHGDGAKYELSLAMEKMKQETTGDYEFENMRVAAFAEAESWKRYDCASFTKHTRVGDTPANGRGLFTTTDIKAGEVVMVERAFAIAFTSDLFAQLQNTYNSNTERLSTGPHATLLATLYDRIQHNPKHGAKCLELYSGGYVPAQVDDGKHSPVVDSFHLQAIIEHNAFGCRDVTEEREASKEAGEYVGPMELRGGLGIWVQASYINHCCVENAHITYLGDMMIVTAVRDIPKGAGRDHDPVQFA